MRKNIFILYALLTSINAISYSDDTKYEIIVNDLNNPWSFVFLNENSILINEKKGELIHFENGRKKIITGLPDIIDLGQGGLLDIELHPNYKSNGWIYITYASSNDENNGANTSLMRFKIKNNQIINKELLYSATPNSKKGQHFGSRIIFDNEYLYFSIGDRGNRNINPQNIKRDGGKIYRFLLTIHLLMIDIQKRQYSLMVIEILKEWQYTLLQKSYGSMSMDLEVEMKLILLRLEKIMVGHWLAMVLII